MTEETKNATHFGEDVFGDEAIRTYLSKDTAKKLQATIQEGKPLDPSIAGEVAHGIRHWAMDRGATHYTHWFLPMTGSTAEKHDSFLEIKDGEPIMLFSASRTPRRFRPAASAPRSRRAATRRGILRALRSSSDTRTARRSASRRRSAPTRARRSTKRLRFSAPCRRSTNPSRVS